MNDEFNGIINGFEIFALHIRIFRVKKVVPTDGPTQAVKKPVQVSQDCRI